MAPKLEESEIKKFWELFSGLNPINGYLSGEQVAPVFKNSRLPDAQLEKIWDLADVDMDGSLDFEEFCVAMKLIYDIVNELYSAPPETLPDWLIPSSKAHLVEARNAINNKSYANNLEELANNSASSLNYDEDYKLSSDFDWYISPSDRQRYVSIYTANTDHHGLISFDSLTELYQSLPDIPKTDISSAWNLVNPRSSEKIDKDQCIVFLHILNSRQKGYRVPRSVPASLRATFEKSQPEYSLNSKQSEIKRNDSSTSSSTSKKDAFGEGYLTRLGLSGRSAGYNSSGTDFSATKDTDWEEVRLKRQLADLDDLISKAEKSSNRRKQGLEDFGSSKSALVKRELEQLLEYKEKQLKQLRDGKLGNGGDNDDYSTIAETIDMLAQQVQSLQQHHDRKIKELEELRKEVNAF
ncbi:hypothetical protein D0Z03_002379 [Geotrichum reessii]|nr:hypothetical protein D0Z03_002379 [Galactomyces reessii]